MSFKKLPKLIVFDLDYTLWPFWVDTHVTPPFRKKNGKVVDMHGASIKFYPEVPQVLDRCRELGCDMGIASRTSEISGANQLVELFSWQSYFKYKEIYPGCKINHFQEFKKQSGLDYSDMLFFDDEDRNIRDLTKLNVKCVLVRDGMNLRELNKGLQLFN